MVKPGTDEIDPTMVAPVMEVGRVTLQGLIDLVVERADRDDLAAMRVELDALGGIVADGGDAASIIGSERRFFRLVFRGTHSLVAELLANTFDQIFDAAIDPEGRVRLHWDDVLVSSGRLDAYRRVVEAIEQPRCRRSPAPPRHHRRHDSRSSGYRCGRARRSPATPTPLER